MTPHEKGWLKSYLDFRKDLLLDLTIHPERKASHPEYSLYRIIQPTGLMYGQSVGELNFPEQENWGQKDRMKILLAESLISSSLLFYDRPVSSHDELSRVIMKTVESIGNFYNNIFPELSTPTKTLFGRRKSALELAEKILDKRIDNTSSYDGNFWATFFHNSLLFLDVFIFGQWIHTNADKIVADFFRYEREELRFSVVKVIAAAAHANKVIAPEEKKLFEYFLQTTELPSDRKKEAMRIFAEGIGMHQINLPSENSWILKKFFVELAILTLWADKRVEEAELDFLRNFCKYFEFPEEELENSMLAIEGFVLEHWQQLDHLQDKQDYKEVSEQFLQRVAKMAEKNKTRLEGDLKNHQAMMQLIAKARSAELTDQEKERVRHELIEVLKTIPTFVIISLPQKFLTLPILLKILPKNLFLENHADPR
jgi:hypothetical protein